MLSFGSAGVDVFFIISGFIICAVLDKEKITSRDFIMRRITRILPTYWVITTIWLAMLFVTKRDLPEPLEFVTSYLVFPMKGFPALGVGWTLEHEFIFYAIAAILIFAGKQLWLARVLAVLFGFGVVFHVILPELGYDDIWDYHLFSLYQINFFSGVMLYRYRDNVSRFNPVMLLIASALVFCAAAVITSQLYGGHVDTQPAGFKGLFRVAIYVIAGLLLLSGLLSLEARSPRFLENAVARTLEKIGEASYGLYLTHLLVFAVISFVLSKIHLPAAYAWGVVIFSLVSAVVVSLLWYSTCEVRLTRWAKQKVKADIFNKVAA